MEGVYLYVLFVMDNVQSVCQWLLEIKLNMAIRPLKWKVDIRPLQSLIQYLIVK